jgi:integrase
MTNPRVVISRERIDGKLTEILDEKATKELRNRDPLSNEEIDLMIAEADAIKDRYFCLRVKALIGIVKKFGKRRSEIAPLERENLEVKNEKLLVTFTLRKKHKKGLFQYLKWLEKHNPTELEKPLAQLKLDWKLWTETEVGYRVKEEKRTKSVDVNDKYAKLILDYLKFLEREYPNAKYVFPSGTEVFGTSYMIFPDQHLSGRQLLRLIKPLNENAWLHLFRETKGAEIARDLGMTITAVTEVKNTLDLENETTAYRYVRRYAVQEMKVER